MVIIILLVLTMLGHLLAPTTHALTLADDEFIIEVDDLMQIEKKQSPPQSASITRGYNNEQSQIGITLSNTILLFDPLIPTNPLIRSQDITISSKGQTGYTLYAKQDHGFTDSTGTSIPDTSCDNGKCSPTTASLWENTLTYGFGYRCENGTAALCKDEFSQAKNAYMRFASKKANEPFRPLLGSRKSISGNAHMLYKINISGTQPQGIYNTSLRIILMPEI